MTTPNSQDKLAGKIKQFVIFGILLVGALMAIGTLLILLDATAPATPADNPTFPAKTTASAQNTQTQPTNNFVMPLDTPAATSATPPSQPAAAASPTLPHINLPATQNPTLTASAPSFTHQILSVGASGVTGTITFRDVAGAVAILLHFDGLPEEELLPVELRHGSCAAPGSLAYPLVSPDGGESETDLSINLAQLNTQKPLAVFLYKSAQDRTVMACGDIP